MLFFLVFSRELAHLQRETGSILARTPARVATSFPRRRILSASVRIFNRLFYYKITWHLFNIPGNVT